MEVNLDLSSHLTSRIKILSDLDIAERRMPQDGRFLVRIKSFKIDLRVATLPTHYGEKVVIRLLTPESSQASFEGLGMSQSNSEAYAEVLTRPQGMVLVCGPTGSGKSTTLYSSLTKLSTRTVNIITVEDPIEYMLEGINQVQVNRKAGLTFASSLRSILRQDPNIVMVGEIRDSETAEISLTAAQTGHLVLSTIHTNDSISTIDRLKDLGVAPFLIASSLTAVVSQRLLRKLCRCHVPATSHVENVDSIPALGMPEIAALLRAPGSCGACDNLGYKGRIGVYEVLIIDEEMRRMIQRGARTDDIRAYAISSSFRPMREDALEKLISGQTTVEEVLRVVPLEHDTHRTQSTARHCLQCNANVQPGFAFCPKCGLKVAAPIMISRSLEQN
jgi:type IV pilus assembly protein PilB